MSNRLTKPTPKFFRIIRNIGLALTAGSAVILTGGVAAPAIVITIAGYCATAGLVASAVAQSVYSEEPKEK